MFRCELCEQEVESSDWACRGINGGDICCYCEDVEEDNSEILLKVTVKDIEKMVAGRLDKLDKLALISEIRDYFEKSSLKEDIEDLVSEKVEDVFRAQRQDIDDVYTMDTSYKSEVLEDCDGTFETYGKDLDYVKKVLELTPSRVWTVIDGNSGLEVITGYHFVNRVHYMVTVEEWKSEDEVYNY